MRKILILISILIHNISLAEIHTNPSPIKDRFTVSIDSPMVPKIELIPFDGNPPFTLFPIEGGNTFSSFDVPNGYYTAKIMDLSGNTHTKRIEIHHEI
jgi:hypothetical protein